MDLPCHCFPLKCWTIPLNFNSPQSNKWWFMDFMCQCRLKSLIHYFICWLQWETLLHFLSSIQHYLFSSPLLPSTIYYSHKLNSVLCAGSTVLSSCYVPQSHLFLCGGAIQQISGQTRPSDTPAFTVEAGRSLSLMLFFVSGNCINLWKDILICDGCKDRCRQQYSYILNVTRASFFVVPPPVLPLLLSCHRTLPVWTSVSATFYYRSVCSSGPERWTDWCLLLMKRQKKECRVKYTDKVNSMLLQMFF